MRLGINWISPSTLPLIREFYNEGLVDFCEVMVDNVVHLEPSKIREALGEIPIALHIVSSRFLERSDDALQEIANHLRPWIKALNPLYVSDHLITSKDAKGNPFPFAMECDYERKYDDIKRSIIKWQQLLDVKMLFENHASFTEAGREQAFFFERLKKETNCGLLFDFSNAYIAHYNGIGDINDWQRLIEDAQHFHVAGFSIDDDTKLAIDTHDAPVNDEVLNFMRSHLNQHKSCVVEFESAVKEERAREALLKIKHLKPQGPTSKNSLAFYYSPGKPEAIASLISKGWHYRVFHLAPKTLALSKQDEAEWLSIFLTWLNENNCVTDWRLSLYFLEWIYQQKKCFLVENEIIKELLIATAINWSLNAFEAILQFEIEISFGNMVAHVEKNKLPNQNVKITFSEMKKQG